MKPRSLILSTIVGLVLLAAGFVAGFLTGMEKGAEVATDTWFHMSHIDHVYPGNQAYTVIRLQELGESARLEWILEEEIDRAIEYVELTQKEHPTDPSHPIFKVYDRLKKYRNEHPWDRPPMPALSDEGPA